MILTRPSGDTHNAAYDACIVGGGAAGITLALQLSGRGLRVCVLEAGGSKYDAVAQSLAEGSVAGDAYPPLRNTRMNVLGGSTQVWAGWCRPLDGSDFAARPDLGGEAWPFGSQELLPYYRQAHDVCGLGAFDYDAAAWSERLQTPAVIEDSDDVVHSMFHVSRRRFGHAFHGELAASPRVHVLLHAPVLHIEFDALGNACGAVARFGGRTETIRARMFVLAAGGIENARLLLASAPDTARAPGNGADLVGRFFTDHPFVNPGALVLHGGPRRLDLYFPQTVPGGEGAVRATLSLPRALLERERLHGCALFFHPLYEAHAAFATPEVRALLEWRDKLRLRAVPGDPWPLLLRAARAPHHLAIAGARKLLVRTGLGSRWRVRMMFETAARPENRVRLAAACDALGRPRAAVDWSVADEEIRGMRRAFALFDTAFRRAGVGRLEPALRDDAAWRGALEGGKHHMGTTRMHADPRRGVVDGDGRVHGTNNLYLAGSSVFPTVGYANPTLTIVALALRLADHLERRCDAAESGQ